MRFSAWTVLGEALVILGLAIGLSVLSYAHYDAREQGTRLRKAIKTSICSAGFDLAVLLLGLGFGLSSRSIWERVLWMVFVLLYAVLAARTWILHRTQPSMCAVTDGPKRCRW